jgi:hypothetical protein
VSGRVEEVLRDLLRGRQVVFPVMVFGMLGGDPNDFTTEEHVRITGWLDALGYERRVRPGFSHAALMAMWVRDDDWPEDASGPRPYAGIPLRRDPDLAGGRAERAARKREFYRRVAALR